MAIEHSPESDCILRGFSTQATYFMFQRPHFSKLLSPRAVRALREVADAAKEAGAWAAKRDVLDFDGPKFTFVLGKLVDYFQEAALAALRNDQSTVKSIMMHFSGIVAKHDAELRRETEKIGYRMDASSAHLPSQELNEPRESSKSKIQQCPEASPTSQLGNNQTTENGAPDNTALQHRVDASSAQLPSQDLTEPRASFKDKIHQSPEPSPTDQSGKKQTTENGAPNNATLQHRERNNRREPEEDEDIEPWEGLLDPESREEDRALFKNTLEIIKRKAESDAGVPPSDWETKSDDDTPSSPSDDEEEDDT
jgi:hypothetical protein